MPGLLSIVEELRESGESRVVTAADEDLAVLTPIQPSKSTTRRPRRKGPFTADDAILGLIGTGTSEGPTDVSENKHKYLAEEYADLHE